MYMMGRLVLVGCPPVALMSSMSAETRLGFLNRMLIRTTRVTKRGLARIERALRRLELGRLSHTIPLELECLVSWFSPR